MKKRICVFFLSLFLLVSCQHLNVKKDANINDVKSYSYYNNILENEIYPKIEKIISKVDKNAIVEEAERIIIAREIFSVLAFYRDSGKIVLNMKRPPVLNFSPAVKLGDGSVINYILLRLEFKDEAISDVYINFSLVYLKAFFLSRVRPKTGI